MDVLFVLEKRIDILNNIEHVLNHRPSINVMMHAAVMSQVTNEHLKAMCIVTWFVKEQKNVCFLMKKSNSRAEESNTAISCAAWETIISKVFDPISL